MTKRAVLGGTTQFSTKALYVSQNSDNVDSITKPMEFHPGMASGMHVFYYTQGTVNAPALGSESSVTITHNWGNTGSHGTNDRPLFAMRWSYPHEIVNGEATANIEKVRSLVKSQDRYYLNLGNITHTIDHLKKQKASVLENLSELELSRQDLIKELTKKYGSGQLNVDTGEFTLTK